MRFSLRRAPAPTGAGAFSCPTGCGELLRPTGAGRSISAHGAETKVSRPRAGDGGCTPHSLFSVLPEKRECAVHGGREKRGAFGALRNFLHSSAVWRLMLRGRKASSSSARASHIPRHGRARPPHPRVPARGGKPRALGARFSPYPVLHRVCAKRGSRRAKPPLPLQAVIAHTLKDGEHDARSAGRGASPCVHASGLLRSTDEWIALRRAT